MIWANNRARLILTGECNINCTYCHNEGQPKNHKFISEKLVQRVNQLMKENDQKLDSITFSGGEPLLHNKLFNIIETLSPNSDKRTLISNGLLINNTNIQSIKNSGITKIRIGVDSLCKKKSRPTSGKNSTIPITEIIELIVDSNIKVELNIVLTKFNSKEIENIISYCIKNRFSAKFFELINVDEFGDIKNEAIMKSNPIIAYDEFKHHALQYFDTYRISTEMGEANVVFEGDGFELRYCKFLCDFQLCYKTGTRIDSGGSVFSCMKRRGKLWISEFEPIDVSLNTLKKALNTGCKK